jgi:hypothetical protein
LQPARFVMLAPLRSSDGSVAATPARVGLEA